MPTTVAAFYTSDMPDGIIETALDICNSIGFETENIAERQSEVDGVQFHNINVPFNGWGLNLKFNLNNDCDPAEPPLSIGLGKRIDPSSVAEDVTYQRRMDVIFELVCQLASALNVEYAPVFVTPGVSVRPETAQITDSVDDIPYIGVYTQEILDNLGGVDGLGTPSPWYTAELDDGRIVVIPSAEPWTEGGWEPPTTADFLTSAEFNRDS